MRTLISALSAVVGVGCLLVFASGVASSATSTTGLGACYGRVDDSSGGWALTCSNNSCTDDCAIKKTRGFIDGTWRDYNYCYCPTGGNQAEPVCCHAVQLLNSNGRPVGMAINGDCAPAVNSCDTGNCSLTFTVPSHGWCQP